VRSTANPAAGRIDWSPWTERVGAAGVILDFDGTLAAIVEDPGQAVLLPGAKRVLGALAERLGLVAVVSGRPIAYLDEQLEGVPGIVLAGLYGLEREVGGGRWVDPAAETWREAVRGSARAAEDEAPPGVEVEYKGLSLVLHARRRPEALPWAQAWAEEQSARSGLRVQGGRLSVELLPPVAMNKGRVVEELAAPVDAVCFVGDDTGDLPAFAALERLRSAGKKTAGVGVRSPEQPEALRGVVDWFVDGPSGVVELLGALARGRPPSSGRDSG
jgi:trehalose 6-phosphate phosphatase